MQLHNMVRRSSGLERLANRSLVLNLHMVEPDLMPAAIGRRLGISRTTVSNILKNYGGMSTANGPPATKKGAGRPTLRTKRWKRFVNEFHCILVNCSVILRALLRLVSKKPFNSLKQLAQGMFEWERDMILRLPPGAVVRTPTKSSHHTIRRYFDS
jgi:hypothetical protein